MIKPVLWTVISLIAIVLSFMSTGGGIWAYVIIMCAVACAALQWMVYYKENKASDKKGKIK